MTTQFPQALLDPLDAIALPATLDIAFIPPPIILGLLTPGTVNAGSQIKALLLILNSQPFPVKDLSGVVLFGGAQVADLPGISLPPGPLPGIAEVDLAIPGQGGEFPVTVVLDWFGTAIERTTGTIKVNPGPPPPPPPTLVSIEVSPDTVDLNLTDHRTEQLFALGRYSNGVSRNLTTEVGWLSSDPSKVSVNSNGLIAAVASGVAAITAQLGGVTSSPPTVITVLGQPPPPGAPPVADFTGAPTTGVAPLLVSFINLTLGEATSYLWDFGDGSTSSLAAPPAHSYSMEGVYPVALTAIGPGGSDTELKTNYITVSAPPPPPPPPPVGPSISAVGVPTISPLTGPEGTPVAAIWAAQNRGDQPATVRLQIHNMSMQGLVVVNGPSKTCQPGEPALLLGASFTATENLNALAGNSSMELRLVELVASNPPVIRSAFPFPFELVTIPPPPPPPTLQSLVLEPSAATLQVGEALQFRVFGLFSDGSLRELF